MDEEEVIADVEMSGMVDGWTEYLCMRVHTDGSVTLASKAYDILGYEGEFEGEVIWPDGIMPAHYDPVTNRYTWGEEMEDAPLPISIAGKKVGSFEGANYLGDELKLKEEDSFATFAPGEADKAREWTLDYYGQEFAEEWPDALAKIERALRR